MFHPRAARLNRHSAYPVHSCDELDGGEEIGGASVVAGCDAAEAFQAADEALDLVALPVAGFVVAGGMLSGRVWRDHRLGAEGGDRFAQLLGVVGTVGEDIAGALAFQQRSGRG